MQKTVHCTLYIQISSWYLKTSEYPNKSNICLSSAYELWYIAMQPKMSPLSTVNLMVSFKELLIGVDFTKLKPN